MKKQKETPQAYNHKGHKNLQAGPEKSSKKIFTKGNKLNKLQVHLTAVLEHCKEKSIKLSKFEKIMFSSAAGFIFIIFASLLVSGIIGAAYPYAPTGGIVTTTSGSVPTNSVVAFNQAACPAGWTLADGTSGTPDLRGIFIRGAGTSGSMLMANGTNFSATYGTYSNDSMQGHFHNFTAAGSMDASGSHSSSSTGNFNYEDLLLDSGGGANPDVWDNNFSIPNGEIVSGATNDSQNAEPRTGAETAPASYAMIYCVKNAEDSAGSNSIWQTLGSIVSLVNSSRTLEVGNLNVTGNLSVVGVTDGSNASQGLVGEYIENKSAATTSGYTASSIVDVGSISLTAGDWDVQGSVTWHNAGATEFHFTKAGISQVSATFDDDYWTIGSQVEGIGQVGDPYIFPQALTPTVRISTDSTTTVYLVGQMGFSGSTFGVGGIIRARRVR